jgi:hypothetical protein
MAPTLEIDEYKYIKENKEIVDNGCQLPVSVIIPYRYKHRIIFNDVANGIP